jgi:CspA family cold shock protein
MNGTVKSYSDFRGYGFIKGEDCIDYFAHVSKITGSGYRSLDENCTVIFEPRYNYRGSYAVDIRVVTSKSESLNTKHSFYLKKNPFTPQDPISNALKFAGRKDAVFNAVDNLYNGKNILITGARGIGKSSLAYQLLYTTAGETELLRRIGLDETELFNNAICDHRCMFGNTLIDIASGLINTLAYKLGAIDLISSQNIGLDLKVFNYSQTETEAPINTSDIASSFATQVEKIFTEFAHDKHGITFLIDEIDTLDSNIDIASFLKSVLEKFRLDSYNSFYVIVSGVTGTITNLIAQHQSAGRLFETILVDKMTYTEIRELIEIHLQDTGVEIDTDALNDIVKYSNDFPQPVHLIAYHAFRIDNNSCIDIIDVNAAIEFIVQNLKQQEYEIKFDSIGRGKNIAVLRRIVQAPYPTVSLNYLSQSGELTYDEVTGVMGELMRQGIVEKSFRNQYRICEPLFSIYLKMVFDI